MSIEDFHYELTFKTAVAFSNTNNTIVKDIKVANLVIRLRFAGDAMLSYIFPAFKHISVSDESLIPDYTINIWDSLSSKVDFPKIPCPIEDIEIRGELKGFNSDEFESCYSAQSQMLSTMYHPSKVGNVCLTGDVKIPAFEVASPLRAIMHWILRKNNMVLLHAASIGTSMGSVLIAGRGGAGKSSTAFRCLIAGMNYFGDDICGLSVQKGEPTINSLYCSGKVLNSEYLKFPELIRYMFKHNEADYNKEVYLLNDLISKSPLNHSLTAIIIPYQNNSLSIGFEKISFAKALSIICSSSKFLLPAAGDEILRLFSTVIKIIPCYQFNLGNNPKKIPEKITKLITSLTT
jgi:hypothetical protein